QSDPEGEHECRICYNLFDLERHAPKLLACLHTFCLECLRELHLRSSPAGGGAAGVTCPVCRHRTALPEGSAYNLPVNTKLVEAILLQLRGWAPLLRDLRSERLLLQPPPASPAARPGRSRSPSARSSSGGGAATPSPTVAFRAVDAGEGAADPHDSDDQCCTSCREKAGCLCFVFAVLAMALLGFAWMEWLTGSIFLGVALLLLFASTMPFMYNFRFRSGPRTIFLPRAEASSSREAVSCRNSLGSRSTADGGSRW
uniref:RING-type domain-containing protein n=1 Tax=Varanus komodoensis TaxID=61221 RepID=A0A8D2L5C5_VARKO